MSTTRSKLPSQTAALAGIPAGIQAAGPWIGCRQLFVRFAGEAETATMYTSEALKGELGRLTARSRYHSIAVSGRDPLAESEYLRAALADAPLPAMLDHDGQRPDALEPLLDVLALVQVGFDGCETAPVLERATNSIACAARKRVKHAAVIVPAAAASDGQLLRVVEQVHGVSADTMVVLHPPIQSAGDPDRRWIMWLERAVQVHEQVRVVPRLPAPTGMR